MPLTEGFVSRTTWYRPLQKTPSYVTALKGNTAWNESLHPRQPDGSSAGGEFAPKGTASSGGDQLSFPKTQSDREVFSTLKARWADLNNVLNEHLDDPGGPEVTAALKEQTAITKQLYTLNVDPGALGLEDVGLPGGPRDVVIIGAGPGGLTAAVHGGVEGYDTLLIDANTQVGGQAKFSARIENFPQAGYPAGVSGAKLAQGMLDTVKRSRADILLGVRVLNIAYDEKTGAKTLTLSNGTTVTSRTVILAGGLQPRTKDFPGSGSEDVHVLDGVSLAREGAGKNVVVEGGSNGAAQAALEVARHAESVTLIARSPIVNSMSEYQRGQLAQAKAKITVIEGEEIAALETDHTGHGRSVVLKNSGRKLPADEIGLFLGGTPNTEWLPDSIKRVDPDPQHPKGGRVVVNKNLETSMPGVYAVGDIRVGGETVPSLGPSKSNGRIMAATGDGAIAVGNAYRFFQKLARLNAPQHAMKADASHWAEARARKAAMKDDVFRLYDETLQVDLDNPWFGQTVEPEPPDYAAVLKFNLNHDEKGLFASAGSGSVAQRPKLVQLIARLATPDGGFTVHPTTGDQPTTGFGVSIANQGAVIPVKDLTPVDLVRHVKANKKLLEQDGNYIGAWHNPDDGKVYLDVSRVVPDRAEAERLGQEHHQIAYFDFVAGKSVLLEKAAA